MEKEKKEKKKNTSLLGVWGGMCVWGVDDEGAWCWWGLHVLLHGEVLKGVRELLIRCASAIDGACVRIWWGVHVLVLPKCTMWLCYRWCCICLAGVVYLYFGVDILLLLVLVMYLHQPRVALELAKIVS